MSEKKTSIDELECEWLFLSLFHYERWDSIDDIDDKIAKLKGFKNGVEANKFMQKKYFKVLDANIKRGNRR
jgi:hypothetical protein